MTALKDLLNNKIRYKNIYEFDLKNFFPSINQAELFSVLSEIKIPLSMIYYFLLPLQEKPKISLDFECRDYQTGKESYFFKSIYEMINFKGESNYIYGKSSRLGVPMGLGYSPLLASLVLIKRLEEWKRENGFHEYITYADDGLIMSNGNLDIELFEKYLSLGKIEMNKEKSS